MKLLSPTSFFLLDTTEGDLCEVDVLVAFRDVYVLVTNDSGANVAFSNRSLMS